MTVDRIVEPLAKRSGERGFLAGTAALVTGGARRIGRTLCLALGLAPNIRAVSYTHLTLPTTSP